MNANKPKTSPTIPDKLESREGYLLSKEVIRILNTDKNTLARWVREGRIRATRIGKKNNFDPAHVAAWLREHEIG